MKRWESVTMAVGFFLLIVSFLFVGNQAVNGVAAALILFPPVLLVIRFVEAKLARGAGAH